MKRLDCGRCPAELELLADRSGFATIPARRELYACPGCRRILRLFLWYPAIDGRQAAVVLDPDLEGWERAAVARFFQECDSAPIGRGKEMQA